MKRALLPVIALFFIWTTIFSQTPQTIPYQAVARNSSGNLLVNQNVSLRFTVHDLTATGGVLYQETQSATTNKLGLFNVNVGAGSVVSGSFSGANWSNGHAKFMQVEIDPAGGSSYTDMGAAQMMSVPYALYAGSAGSVPSGNLTESTSNVLSITGGSSSVLSASGTTIQVKKATSSQDGYLASADWTTFNNKQSALTFNAPLSNASNTISCATCATTTNGGALTGTAPVSVSASGAISCATCLTTSSLTGLANPSATIGMTATNGSATTAMRSDAAPAINAGITPAWTGTHTFSNSTYSAVFTGGPVGIGTASPNAELHVVTGDQSGGSLAGWGTAEMVIGKAGSTGGGLGLSYDGTNSVATIYALAPSVAWKDLAFRANNTVFYYGGGTEGMRLNTSGNVGIGTSTPAVKTEIAAGATELLKLSSTIGGTNNHSYIDFLTYASTSGVVGRIGAIDMGNYNGSLVFEVNNQTSANSSTTTEAMRVTNSGPFIAGTYMTPGNIETIYDGAGTNSGYHVLRHDRFEYLFQRSFCR